MALWHSVSPLSPVPLIKMLTSSCQIAVTGQHCTCRGYVRGTSDLFSVDES
jgi:hypothetical protein